MRERILIYCPARTHRSIIYGFLLIMPCTFLSFSSHNLSAIRFSRLETKKCETMKHELDDMKKKLNALSADNNRLKGNLNTLDGKEKHQRKRVDEMNQQMVECEEKLRLANKEKVIILIIGSSTSLFSSYRN